MKITFYPFQDANIWRRNSSVHAVYKSTTRWQQQGTGNILTHETLISNNNKQIKQQKHF